MLWNHYTKGLSAPSFLKNNFKSSVIISWTHSTLGGYFEIFSHIKGAYIIDVFKNCDIWTINDQCSLSYRNQSVDLHCKSIDWFLYDGEQWWLWCTLWLTGSQLIVLKSSSEIWCMLSSLAQKRMHLFCVICRFFKALSEVKVPHGTFITKR